MEQFKKKLKFSLTLLAAFIIWTLLLCYVDVKNIGPQNSTVGLSTINHFVHNLTGVNLTLYVITDWLSLIPLGICAGFAVMGMLQWYRRKQLLRVDFSILVLGGFYLVVMFVFLLFEILIINYRPILIDGCLEASYPSSTTMLTLCVMCSTMLQLKSRIKHQQPKCVLMLAFNSFTVFMVIGRFLSGVHWFSDIVGGCLLSAALIALYDAVCSLEQKP